MGLFAVNELFGGEVVFQASNAIDKATKDKTISKN